MLPSVPPARRYGLTPRGRLAGLRSAVITAIVMICVEADKIPEVAQPIADVDGVSEVYSVAGDVDLIAIVRVREFDEIADVDRRPAVEGRRACSHTDTHIAFRAYSRHDLEATFALGVE